jgi:hypothetical protein
MACTHKFLEYLNLEQINFEPTTLIVGTFNPGWENINNDAQWFYGRTRNNYFWDVLPRLYEDINLRQQTNNDWKQFCSRNSIALTDLLQSINDANPENPYHITAIQNFKDSEIANVFNDFIPTNIIEILQNKPSITHVYLTRQLGSALWDNLWNNIVEYCQLNRISTQTLLTPSASARFQMNGGLLRDFIYNEWSNVWHPIN